MASVAEAVAAARETHEAREQRRAARPTKDAKAKFRSSLGWRRTRYAVLAENAKRHDGTARCELCGATAAPGAALHVDHIEAVSKNWSRRLDKTNLQVLCPDCNIGKLAGPAQDFRHE